MAKDAIIDGGVFKMNWATGKLEPLNVAPKLQRGQLIYAYGYACCLQMFAVVDPEARRCVEIDREPVNEVNDLPDDYFSPVHTYDERIEPHSKKFGIGFYYADAGEELATDEQIAAGLERAERVEHFRQVKAENEKKAMNEAQAAARAKYGRILDEVSGTQSKGTRSGNTYVDGTKVAAQNLRKLLRHTFPGFKFSLRRSSGSYYYLDWTDGPTREAVDAVASLFDDQVRDRYNDDLWDSVPNGFTSLYGSLSCFCQRSISEEKHTETLVLLHAYFRIADDSAYMDKCDMLNAAEESLPDAWREVLEGCTGWTSGNASDWAYTFAHGLNFLNEAEPKEEAGQTAPAEPIKADGVEIVDYSEKALAVVGDTRRYADTFKALGGRFNARLSCGAGWIFSKRKEAELRAALAL